MGSDHFFCAPTAKESRHPSEFEELGRCVGEFIG